VSLSGLHLTGSPPSAAPLVPAAARGWLAWSRGPSRLRPRARRTRAVPVL